MRGRGSLVFFLAASVLVCAYDITLAVRGHGNTWIAWLFALVFAGFALYALAALLRAPQPPS